MPSIPLVEALLFDPGETRTALISRFEEHLRRLRRRRLDQARPDGTVNDHDEIKDEDRNFVIPDRIRLISLGGADMERIQRQARRIIERRKAACGLDHRLRR